MSSTQPLFVIYDRQYGTYIRLYDYLPDVFDSRERYTLFDLQRQESYSGNSVEMQQQRQQRQQRPQVRQQQRPPVQPQVRQQQRPPVQPQQRPQVRQQQQRDVPKFVTDLILRDAAAEGKLCPITMEPIEATEAYTVTACYHAFNKEALGRWLRDHSTCPECNGRL